MTGIEKNGALLIDHYDRFDSLQEIKNEIITGDYTSVNQVVPMCRFRGTIIEAPVEKKGPETIIGWQRNVSRIRKMDVSLPTVITLTVNDREEIDHIELDQAFRGSKGLLCSRNYLDTVLKEKLTGLKLDAGFFQTIILENLHCFHLVEVLNGVASVYRLLKDGKIADLDKSGRYYEEESIDCHIKDGDCYALSRHLFKGKPPLTHTLRFHDIFKTVHFDKAGNLKGLEKVRIDFLIDDHLILTNEDLIGKSQTLYRDFLKFILRCVNELKKRISDDTAIRLLNTNLFPGALIGLIVQALAMQTFKNNYTYVMHALTALQRPNDRPLCLGAIKTREEAEIYFKGYDFENLLS